MRDDDLMPFGKHKGEKLVDIPDSYFRWLSTQEFVEEQYPELFEYITLAGSGE